MKTIFVVIVSINVIFSFFKWSIYTYNASQESHYSNLLDESFKRNNTSDIEKTEYLTERKTLKSTWSTSKNEWLLKLIIDLVVLVFVLYFIYYKRIELKSK